jgi:hypothetical protein
MRQLPGSYAVSDTLKERKFNTLSHVIAIEINVSTTTNSRDSSVGIATDYGLDDGGNRSSSPGKVKNFLFSKSSRPALGSTQPPIQWVPRGLSPGVKRSGR